MDDPTARPHGGSGQFVRGLATGQRAVRLLTTAARLRCWA